MIKLKLYTEQKHTNVQLPSSFVSNPVLVSMIQEDFENYEMLWLYWNISEEDDVNHGNVSGVALNRDTNTIIYWYEFW